MPESSSEIWLALIIGTFTIVILGSIFIAAILFNQKRFIASQKEKLKILEDGKQQLEESHNKLRQLAAHLQSVREDERTNIAREIHDELGQMLTVLKIDVSLLKRKIHLISLDGTSAEAVQNLSSMSDLIDNTIKSVRRIATELRPKILDDLGLKDAIEWETQVFQTRTGIKVEFVSNVNELQLDSNRATAVFRIFQETLTNVARHANATEVSATFEQVGNEINLSTKDNGKGISEFEAAGTKSLGLLGIRERALFLGGEVTIGGEKDKGTTVTVRIPIEVPKSA